MDADLAAGVAERRAAFQEDPIAKNERGGWWWCLDQ
jgi:hypothetical protein